VAITLQTVTPTLDVQLPTLYPWRLQVHRQPEGTPKRKGQARTAVTAYNLMSADIVAAPPAVAVDVRSNSTFEVPGKVTVPSDGSTHAVLIGEFDLDAELKYLAFPRVEPKCHVKVPFFDFHSVSLFFPDS
jgi:hypothetical protein